MVQASTSSTERQESETKLGVQEIALAAHMLTCSKSPFDETSNVSFPPQKRLDLEKVSG